MRFGHPDTHWVHFNGQAYRVEVVRGESLLGSPEATLWIGKFHRKLSAPVDEAQIERVARALLDECELQNKLYEISEDPYSVKQLASQGDV